MKNFKYYTLYIFYKVFRFIFLILPKPLTKKILEFFSYLIYKIFKRRTAVARANLNLVFKYKSTEEKENIIYQSYKTLAFNMYELIENQKLSKEEMFKKAEIINDHIIPNAIKQGRRMIFVTAHYGGWELTLPCLALRYDMRVGVVNKKMQNPYIHKEYAKAREKNNITMIEKQVAAKKMIKALSKNEKFAIVIDQYSDEGSEIEFLGIKDMAIDSVARLALKFDALIIPIFNTKNDFRRYTIEIRDPIDPLSFDYKTEDKIKELTQAQNDLISKQIFKDPNHWLWQHKRFRRYNSEIYN